MAGSVRTMSIVNRLCRTMGVRALTLAEIRRDGKEVSLACGIARGELVALDLNGCDWSDVLTDGERLRIQDLLSELSEPFDAEEL